MKKNILLIILISISQFLSAQTINVTYPNGGEYLMKNTWSPHNITWESSGVSTVNIEYSDDNGTTWHSIETNYSNTNFYSWSINDIESTNCLVKISDAGGSVFDESDANFIITAQKLFIAEWNTSMGLIRAELRGDFAPITSQNFMNLAQKGFYTNLIFHRVISGFMIQDGCPLGNGTGGPGYSFNDEFNPNLTHSFPGVLAMANSGPNTNGSQYYITVAPTSWLDNSYSIFGRIIDGIDVVYAISEVETNTDDKPLTDIDLSINIVESNPSLTLQYPSTGLKLEQGRQIEILWDSDFIADAKIEFSNNNGADWETVTDSIASGIEKFIWNVPEIVSTECIIKITSLKDEMVFSQNVFEIRNKPVVISRLEFYNNVIPSTNNPENLISLGKTFRFKLKIKNESLVNITSLNANLTCKNTDLTITNGSITYSNLSQNENIWIDDEIEIQLPETFPTTGEFSFSLYGTASNIDDNFWIGDFNLPVLDIFSFITIDDDMDGNSNGNNNHILENGETIELKLPISNKSEEVLYDVFGQLTTNTNYINIWNEVDGTNGIVYDTTKYNNFNPINPNSSVVHQENFFVFDYNETDIYQTDFLLKVNGFLNESEGTSWEDGGVKIKWGISKTLNNTYPPAIINDLKLENNKFVIMQNPVSDYISVSYNLDKNNSKLEVFNMQGKLLISKLIGIKNGEKKINISTFENGLYFVKINNIVKRFIVMK